MAQLRALFQTPELIAETCRVARQKEAAEIEHMKAERFELAGELPRVVDSLRKREVEKRIAEIDGMVVALEANPLSENQVAEALRDLDQAWDELFPSEQARIVALLIERITVANEGIDVRYRHDGLHTLVNELKGIEEEPANEREADNQG